MKNTQNEKPAIEERYIVLGIDDGHGGTKLYAGLDQDGNEIKLTIPSIAYSGKSSLAKRILLTIMWLKLMKTFIQLVRRSIVVFLWIPEQTNTRHLNITRH